MKFQILNAYQLKKRLAELPNRVQAKVMRSATYSGAALVRKEARRRVPVRQVNAKGPKGAKKTGIGQGVVFVRFPGNLKKNVVTRRVAVATPRWVVRYQIGYKGSAFYGLFLEKGSAHQPARPWLRPAYEAAKRDIQRLIAAKVLAGIERETAKLRR